MVKNSADRRPGGIGQCWVFDRKACQVTQIMISATLDRAGVFESELPDKSLEDAKGDTGLIQEPGGQTGVPPGKFLFDLLRNIALVFVLEVQFGIPGDLQAKCAADGGIREDKGQILAD